MPFVVFPGPNVSPEVAAEGKALHAEAGTLVTGLNFVRTTELAMALVDSGLCLPGREPEGHTGFVAANEEVLARHQALVAQAAEEEQARMQERGARLKAFSAPPAPAETPSTAPEPEKTPPPEPPAAAAAETNTEASAPADANESRAKRGGR
jgi:hypothetical protein